MKPLYTQRKSFFGPYMLSQLKVGQTCNFNLTQHLGQKRISEALSIHYSCQYSNPHIHTACWLSYILAHTSYVCSCQFYTYLFQRLGQVRLNTRDPTSYMCSCQLYTYLFHRMGQVSINTRSPASYVGSCQIYTYLFHRLGKTNMLLPFICVLPIIYLFLPQVRLGWVKHTCS